MPWTPQEMMAKKKGMTMMQAKKCAKVANGVYKTCMAENGDDKTCAPKAIKIGLASLEKNSKRMK